MHFSNWQLPLYILIVTPRFPSVTSYRIAGSEDEETPFVVYEKGFVDESGETKSAAPVRNNQGYDSFHNFIFDDEVMNRRLQSCPGMIGPLTDGKFYCLAKEYGYCDRRSGTCFCNDGYKGEKCEECDPNHHRVGSLCYEKVMCPNHCSFQGECNFLTGKCTCNEFREGPDCSTFKCSKFHSEQCTLCNDRHCLQCSPGFSVNIYAPPGGQCEPCYRYDPRCTACDEVQCLECTDLLLQSIKRSGRRKGVDVQLPPDELQRQLSISVPFGSKQTNAFDEAEIYDVIDDILVPLHQSSIQCDQGTTGDASFSCSPIEISNVVCGHRGVFSFTSPEYQVSENAGYIRITVRRSGGGVGKAEVSYGIDHITTDDSDVTPTAYYSDTQRLSFLDHEVQKSFLLTINDDNRREDNETFGVFLFDPTNLSQLGNQWKTMVEIVDDDQYSLSMNENVTVTLPESSLSKKIFQLNNIFGSNTIDLDDTLFILAERKTTYDIFSFFVKAIVYDGVVGYDLGRIDKPGDYIVHVHQIVQGGLVGYYYSDLLLSNIDKTRVDANLNFTWSESLIQSARWDGFIQFQETDVEECCTFYVSGKNVRLWIDRYLIIDEWDHSLEKVVQFSGFYPLRQHEVVELMVEVRDIDFKSPVTLMWSANGFIRTVVHPDSFSWKDKISVFEFSF